MKAVYKETIVFSSLLPEELKCGFSRILKHERLEEFNKVNVFCLQNVTLLYGLIDC